MINKSFFIITLFFTGQIIFASDNLDAYLRLVKNMDYQEAGTYSQHLDNKDMKTQAIALSKVLFNAGQISTTLTVYNGDNKATKALHLLAKGYEILYSDPYSSRPFDIFNQAFGLSEQVDNSELTKLCLNAILDVYNYEVSQSNNDCANYLKRSKLVATDSADLFYYYINTLLYQLRSVKFDGRYPDAFIREFENLMLDFQKGHPFWLRYWATVGVYWEKRDQRKSIRFYKNTLKNLGEELYLKRLGFRCHVRLSEIERRKENFDGALKYLDSAQLFSNKADSIRSDYYLSWYASNNYSGLGDFKNAYLFSKKSDSLKTLLDFQSNSLEISRLNAKYQTAEKEKQILVEQQRARKNRNWLIAASLALVFGTGIAILLQKNTRKKRQLAEQTTLLEQQKVQTLLKEQELVSIDAMIAGQEKERTKVANELHDDLGSLMATVKLHFDNVKVDEKDPAMKNAQDLLERAYQKIRGIAHAKNSGVMANQGLLPAVKKMAKTISETNALKVTVEDFGLADRMENSLELTLFRILQELVANIIKHAGATKATIQFTQHEDKLNIIVEDDGKGFEMGKVKTAASGMGLTTIEKRIEHLEGSFTVDSVSGKGTSILIDIPV